MPYGGREVEILLDLLDHCLLVTTSDGQQRTVGLTRRPACADVYRQLFAALHEVGVDVEIHPEPFDLGDSPPFADDTVHARYEAEAVTRYWRVLAATNHVLAEFSSRFNGKASPIHLFWHTFDLAHARYSGRQAPVSAEADPVTAEAYSHEVIAFGFWPGDEQRTPYPAFYSYTAPEPDGLTGHLLEPSHAEWQDTGSGHLAVLPYDAMRTAPNPHRCLLAFYESAYRAGASSAGWDTAAFATRSAPQIPR
jgi:hypothetical protein